jgi:4'-phosphopantetheinyl transferase
MDTRVPLWSHPPKNLVLGCDDVHIWRATLDLPAPCVQLLEQTLVEDESTRADLFRSQKDRTHYVVARGLLRNLLGRYLLRDPRSLRFQYNPYGKPTLTKEGSGDNDVLSFNVTHAHGMALYAMAWGRDIGIDLERIRVDVAWEEIAAQFFSPYEVSRLRALPHAIQHKAFFACWTRKEAYLKARGIGLSLALSQFDVSVTPGLPAALLGTREEDQDISRWSLYDLFPGSGFVGALAMDGPPCRLSDWQWSEVGLLKTS